MDSAILSSMLNKIVGEAIFVSAVYCEEEGSETHIINGDLLANEILCGITKIGRIEGNKFIIENAEWTEGNIDQIEDRNNRLVSNNE